MPCVGVTLKPCRPANATPACMNACKDMVAHKHCREQRVLASSNRAKFASHSVQECAVQKHLVSYAGENGPHYLPWATLS
jgi:hypothetical protein